MGARIMEKVTAQQVRKLTHTLCFVCMRVSIYIYILSATWSAVEGGESGVSEAREQRQIVFKRRNQEMILKICVYFLNLDYYNNINNNNTNVDSGNNNNNNNKQSVVGISQRAAQKGCKILQCCSLEMSA